MAPRRPTSTGRKKIEIRRIESKQGRQVCFSKRRVGLFKKASELATICDAKVAAVAFSPGGKPFTFGHPSVESVLDRFYSSETQAGAVAGGGERNQALADLNQENDELRSRLEAEKARKEAAEEVLAKARAEGCQMTAWLDAYVILMGEEDLVAFADVLAKVHAAVAARADQVLQEALLTHLRVHGGGGGFDFGGTSGGMETLHKLHMMMAMPPPAPGYAAGMEMTLQGFGPHGFPQ
ncbi:hypothetical protein ACQ4PT_070387 [Festuca glaucescens]